MTPNITKVFDSVFEDQTAYELMKIAGAVSDRMTDADYEDIWEASKRIYLGWVRDNEALEELEASYSQIYADRIMLEHQEEFPMISIPKQETNDMSHARGVVPGGKEAQMKLDEVVEVCPHCDSQCIFEDIDPVAVGYKVVCPYCGAEIMLCDACQHADDNECMHCDWHKEIRNGKAHGVCFRGVTTNKS